MSVWEVCHIHIAELIVNILVIDQRDLNNFLLWHFGHVFIFLCINWVVLCTFLGHYQHVAGNFCFYFNLSLAFPLILLWYVIFSCGLFSVVYVLTSCFRALFWSFIFLQMSTSQIQCSLKSMKWSVRQKKVIPSVLKDLKFLNAK